MKSWLWIVNMWNMERCGRGLFQGTITPFAYRDTYVTDIWITIDCDAAQIRTVYLQNVQDAPEAPDVFEI